MIQPTSRANDPAYERPGCPPTPNKGWLALEVGCFVPPSPEAFGQCDLYRPILFVCLRLAKGVHGSHRMGG